MLELLHLQEEGGPGAPEVRARHLDHRGDAQVRAEDSGGGGVMSSRPGPALT